MKFLALALALFFSLTVFAHAPKTGTVYGTFGPYLYHTPAPTHSPLLGGVALIAEGDVDKNGGVEIGLFYLHKPYFREKRGAFLVEKMKRMDITLGYRHWVSDRFSAALAFSTAYSMGDAQEIRKDAGLPTDFSTTASKITEYGVNLSLLSELHRFKNGDALTLDARYTYPLNGKSGERNDVVGAVIGVKFFVQENEKVEASTQ